jgi:hypothetical protein
LYYRKLKTEVEIKNGQSRDTGKIGHKRNRTKNAKENNNNNKG